MSETGREDKAMYKAGDKVVLMGAVVTVRFVDETDEGTRLYLDDGGWTPAAWVVKA